MAQVITDDGIDQEPREVIHRVATNQRAVMLSLAAGLLSCWVAAINMGFSEEAGRWLVTKFGDYASPEYANYYLAFGCGCFCLSLLFWLLSGNGNRAFEITSQGIIECGLGGGTLYPWNEFTTLERNVGAITMQIGAGGGGFFGGGRQIVFNLAGLDWTSTELEAVIVYHRPDLFSAQSQFGVNRQAAAA